MSSAKSFLKYGLQDNNWVEKSLMKSVGAIALQKRKTTREGKNYESEKFEMEVLNEGVIDKDMTVPGKKLDNPPPWKIIYEAIDNE